MPPITSDDAPALAFETDHCRFAIGADGNILQFADTSTGADYCAQGAAARLARVRKDGRDWPASSIAREGDTLGVEFEGANVAAAMRVETRERYYVIEVLSVTGDGVDELVIIDVPLALHGAQGEPFAACALALNLQTNVADLPGANVRLKAMCYPRFGFAGAKVAVIGCPYDDLRTVMQEAVSDAPDLPHSPLGGPWALEPSVNRGSYLFNFGDLTEDTADEWIHVAQELGFDQIDFHGGRSFRFGDCRPDPGMYPDGFRSLRAAVDKLHDAGISAGLHTYAHCISKETAWVTPVPHPGLASDAAFTLAEPLSADATTIRVLESTDAMSTTTGLFSRNSVTLRVDEELITFDGIDTQPPYGFTGCTRGACGTRVAPHARGAQAHHLLEFFGLFAPDGDSPLLAEVAAKTAEAFNTCGFDMMYLDALDAEDMMGGPENGWHYGSKFVFELWKRLDKPAAMEMSTFHHHLWFVRSRLGAWDHPRRGYKTFIDIHCASNGQAGASAAPAVGDHGFSAHRNMLPAHLGWFAPLPWDSPQQEPTHTDDIEYLCGKALGSDSSFSMMQVDPSRLATSPGLPRLAAVCKKYETLRRADCVPESVRALLRTPGSEFTLAQTAPDRWQFRPTNYDRHTTHGLASGVATWTARNPFGSQPMRLRIEALMSSGGYDAPDNVFLAAFDDAAEASPAEWAVEAAEGVTASLEPSSEIAAGGRASGCYRARNDGPERRGAWAKVSREFTPALDLSAHQGIGVWVHGDGRGEVLNFQVKSPESVALGTGEHYVVVDFEGWRYFELVEFEGDRCGDYEWPYSRDLYSIFRESVNFGSVGTLSVWYNDLPPGEEVVCHLGPIKALPLVEGRLRRPSVSIDGERITFPVEIEAGSYIEYSSTTGCVLYGPSGEALCDVLPEGNAPNAQAGENVVQFACDVEAGERPRARVTIITEGEPLPEIRYQ